MEPAARNAKKTTALTRCAAFAFAVTSGALGQDGAAAPDADDAAGGDQAVQAYLSEDALQLQYERSIEVDDFGALRGRAGIFYNEQRDLIGLVDLLAPVGAEDFGSSDVRVHVGSRLYGAFLADEDQDLFAISVGGEAEYFFGGATSVLLAAYYAPDILTFGAADNFTDITLRLRTRLGDGTDVFVGYRTFEIDTLIDREVDDNMHVGFVYSF